MSFALQFEFLEDAPGVADQAEAATWAELGLDVAGVSISELVDVPHRRVRSHFFGSALPLAEWLLESWPRLVHERRVPHAGTDPWWDWRGAHNFRTGRRGGAMPNVELSRFSDDTFEVHARADEGALAPGMGVRFVRSVHARVGVEEVLAGFDRFLRAVGDQLHDVDTNRARAFRDRLAARDLSNGAQAIVGRLGASGAMVQALLAEPRREELMAVMEASAAPTLDDRVREARQVVALLPTPPGPEARWADLQQRASKTTATAPWLAGWSAAEQLRGLVGLAPALPLARGLDGVREATGWDALAWVKPAAELATEVDTVHARAPGAPPCVVTTVRAPEARLFRVGRALYHGLFGGSWRLLADSRLLGSRASEANAFAAELVAPAARLQELAPADGVWKSGDVDAAAVDLGASAQVVRHQVSNREGLGVLGEE